MNYRQKQKMEEIVLRYFVFKNQFNVMAFSSGDYDYSHPYYQYYRDVELAINRLNSEEKLIISNDFFVNSPSKWWKEVYTKEDYVRYKAKAITNFLRYFDENH